MLFLLYPKVKCEIGGVVWGEGWGRGPEFKFWM